jgi:SPP1 family predicted phage head-tail adaptor
MATTPAGRLNCRVQIYRASDSVDATTRQPKETFALLATVWAKREARGSSEEEKTLAVRAATLDAWLIRKRSDLKEKDELRYGGKRYRIIGFEYAGRDFLGVLTKLYA